MCGIAGCVTFGDEQPIEREDLLAMVGALQHRGPDESGIYRDHRAALGHARLSIIDLSTGQQPMGDADGRIWLVYNGEIFNYLELRAELEALGHRFRTASDTEVLLQAYLRWGADAFPRFNGQFAVAIWDSVREELTLARDRLGVRPLFICQRGSRIWFGSEVKAIFAGDPSIPRALDADGLAETFTFWTTVAPNTVFTGVSEIEPGHMRIVTRHGSVDRAYWTPTYPDRRDRSRSMSLDEATEQVRDALDQAVRLRVLRADVPVGSYLSGGLDSSLVAAMGRRYEGDRYITFSIRFDDAEFDESHYQRLMSSVLGSEHREIVVGRQDIAAAFPDVVWHAERPILRTAPAPLYLLSNLVHEAGIKVVLTGEGADEMFAGYDLFREGKVRRFWARRADSEIRPLLLERLYPYLSRSPVGQRHLARSFFGADLAGAGAAGFAHGPRWRSTGALQQLFSAGFRELVAGLDPARRLLDAIPAASVGWSPLAQDRYIEIRTLLSGYLLSSQGDRMLMAHSVEGRFPFLDREVVELANSLPDAYLLRGMDEKHILKRVAKGLVPDEIIARPKQPYRAPDAVAFGGTHPLAWVTEVLDERAIARAGIFDPSAVGRLWRKVRASADRGLGNADNMALVGFLSTSLLHERFVEQHPVRVGPSNLRTIVDRVAATPGSAERPSTMRPFTEATVRV
jgi:asparagine synthase (glutamine-hydrolysing)